jgi:hypothetical protein
MDANEHELIPNRSANGATSKYSLAQDLACRESLSAEGAIHQPGRGTIRPQIRTYSAWCLRENDDPRALPHGWH